MYLQFKHLDTEEETMRREREGKEREKEKGREAKMGQEERGRKGKRKGGRGKKFLFLESIEPT